MAVCTIEKASTLLNRLLEDDYWMGPERFDCNLEVSVKRRMMPFEMWVSHFAQLRILIQIHLVNETRRKDLKTLTS